MKRKQRQFMYKNTFEAFICFHLLYNTIETNMPLDINNLQLSAYKQ